MPELSEQGLEKRAQETAEKEKDGGVVEMSKTKSMAGNYLYGYVREAFYRNRADALKEAKRLRETGRYNARVLRTTPGLKRYSWTLWTQNKRLR